MASRDKIVDVEAYPLRDVRDAICRLIPEDQKHISEKDVHLLEAAVKGDKCVISLDDRARRQFSIVAPAEKVTEDIMWVNPIEDPGVTTNWLEKGAEFSSEWVLGRPEVPAAAAKMVRKKRKASCNDGG